MASNQTEKITPPLIFHPTRKRQWESSRPVSDCWECFNREREKATLKAWPSHFQVLGTAAKPLLPSANHPGAGIPLFFVVRNGVSWVSSVGCPLCGTDAWDCEWLH